MLRVGREWYQCCEVQMQVRQAGHQCCRQLGRGIHDAGRQGMASVHRQAGLCVDTAGGQGMAAQLQFSCSDHAVRCMQLLLLMPVTPAQSLGRA